MREGIRAVSPSTAFLINPTDGDLQALRELFRREDVAGLNSGRGAGKRSEFCGRAQRVTSSAHHFSNTFAICSGLFPAIFPSAARKFRPSLQSGAR